MSRQRIAIIFGGVSHEHEISLISANNIIASLDLTKYEPFLISIDRSGTWHKRDLSHYLDNAHKADTVCLSGTKEEMAIHITSQGLSFISLDTYQRYPVDIVFPILHGKGGEDGTLQGLLQLAQVPFVGTPLLGSAIGMDKEITKRLLREANIRTAKSITLHAHNKYTYSYAKIVSILGSPFFLKSAHAGSSIGVHKIFHQEAFASALEDAFIYGKKVLCEEYIQGREIECAVLGNEHPIASLPGEIVPHHEFYSYASKYLDPQGASLLCPAQLPPDVIKEVQELSLSVFQCLECEGMARVDFFLSSSGELLVNEVNTIPGFTAISMYPNLWNHSQLSMTQLIDRLITLAFERHRHLSSSIFANTLTTHDNRPIS